MWQMHGRWTHLHLVMHVHAQVVPTLPCNQQASISTMACGSCITQRANMGMPHVRSQDAVIAGGPLLCVLGFIILPLIWSVPEALVTAELATAFPENSGYVAWVTAAFGPFWGFQVGRQQGTGPAWHVAVLHP
jgi:hypothetical protein